MHTAAKREGSVSRAPVAELYELQQLDLEIDRSRIEAEAIRRSLTEDVARPAREAAARARENAVQARRQASEAEAAVHELEARIQKQDARLYGGGTAQRDLGALQSELSHLKAAHAVQEERVLAVMLEAEEAAAAAARAAEAQETAVREWEQRRGKLRAGLAEAEAAMADLRARRDAQAAGINAEALRRYDVIRQTHGGRGVALVQSGTCQACRVAITSGALQRARAGAELVPCPNCGRILYVR
jgi:uncharacterized protein